MSLSEQIRQQIEFYFGDANLSRDTFLKERIAQERDGFVTIECLLTFKKLAGITTDASAIVEALKESATLEVSEDEKSVKRKTKFDDSIDFSKYTVVVFPVPGESGETEVRTAVADYAGAANIAAIWRKRKKHPETKIPVNIAEIHCVTEADAAALIEKSENGKKIAFANADVLSEEAATAMPKPEFDALYVKKEDNGRPKPKGADFTVEDVKSKVVDLTAECPIGTVKYIKNIPHESVRSGILYAHVLEGEKNRMLVVFETAEGCAEAMKAYAEAEIEVKPEETEGEEKKKAGITAQLVEDETMLETVLNGLKNRIAMHHGNKKSFGKRRVQMAFGNKKRRRS